MTERFRVEVEADQFRELCKPSQPLAAVLELIWNALDAEANNVTVSIGRTALDAVATLIVTDDGHGMPFAEASREFRTVGGSWKRDAKLSHNGLRTLHGKKGQGRFRAFALGRTAEWESVAEGLDGLERVIVRGSLAESEFVLEGPEVIASGATGTTVRTTDAEENTRPLLGDRARDWLLVRLTPYLTRYPDVSVIYDGVQLDPKEVVIHHDSYPLAVPAGSSSTEPAVLEVMEWSSNIVGFKQALLLCDANGVVLHEIDEGLPMTSRRLTANLVWAGLEEFADRIELAEMDGDVLAPLIQQARDQMLSHAKRRDDEEKQTRVAKWKSKDVYPYSEAPQTPIEQAERAVFDAVATFAGDAIPDQPVAAWLSLRLIREALHHSPASLHDILREVLNLTPDQLETFARVLRNTTLPAIIEATSLVTDRLNFLQHLEDLLFSAEGLKMVNERDHLHKILEQHTWIFGEEYGLTVSERTLTNVVRAHLELLGDESPVIDEVPDSEGNTRRRVDLMLSRTANGPRGRRHLIVELKRPSHNLDRNDLNQITNYAMAVTSDPAYRSAEVEWEFWLVGDDYSEYVERMVNQDHLPSGVTYQSGGVTIHVRRWAEVIEENRQRLHFYRDRLHFEPDEESTISELLHKLLPDSSDPT